MSKSQSRSSAVEPDSFYAEAHFADCNVQSDPEGVCDCDEILRDMRAEFAFNDARCY